jgi:hypothetical protein
MSGLRRAALPLLAALWVGCGSREPAPPAQQVPTLKGPDGREYVLLARGPHKPVFESNSLSRVEYDRNGDGKADQIAHHDGARLPSLVEDDDDFDGKTDRWLYYNAGGVLTKQGTARKESARPNFWVFPGEGGRPARQEYDEDGDGRVDRAEVMKDGRVVRTEVDADRDGKFDRWQNWELGRLVSEELDTDGDGKPDRRLRYGEKGQVVALEPLTHE